MEQLSRVLLMSKEEFARVYCTKEFRHNVLAGRLEILFKENVLINEKINAFSRSLETCHSDARLTLRPVSATLDKRLGAVDVLLCHPAHPDFLFGTVFLIPFVDASSLLWFFKPCVCIWERWKCQTYIVKLKEV
jgi:hypothetical protein